MGSPFLKNYLEDKLDGNLHVRQTFMIPSVVLCTLQVGSLGTEPRMFPFRRGGVELKSKEEDSRNFSRLKTS